MDIQAATSVVMVLGEADAGLRSGKITTSLREVCRQRHCEPSLKQPSFNSNMTYNYVQLLNFKIEAMYSRQKIYELTEEHKFPITKNWLGREGLQPIKTFMNTKKEACK